MTVTRAAVTLGLLATAWGAIPLLVRTDVDAMQLVAMRALLGSATLLVLLQIRGSLAFPNRHRGRLVVA
ncbi:MAG: hypothetical protein HKN93_09995, partial [Acidimicrobiia bacterium]|nr:hypothetical protein [Acidimicrobiia bacterium]